MGTHLQGLDVKFAYTVSGTVTASPDSPPIASNGSAGADFGVTLTDSLGTDTAGGSVSVTKVGATDDLLGETFEVEGYIDPTDPLLLQANLGAFRAASSSNGVGASYSANLSDTAQFLGVSFFADAADTIALPNVQLQSALGFDYIPTDAILSSASTGAVPKASTWAMMLAGFGGLGPLAARRAKKTAGA